MNRNFIYGIVLLMMTSISPLSAEDRIELEVTTIKGNKELPKILFVVPWKDMEKTAQKEQKLVLHSLFGEMLDPVAPEYTTNSSSR